MLCQFLQLAFGWTMMLSRRVANSLRLGIPMCHPHVCSYCGAEVNNIETHGLGCRFNKGHHSRHAALNDIIKCALDSGNYRLQN